MIRQILSGSTGAGLIGLGLMVALDRAQLEVVLSGWTLVIVGAAAMSWAVGA